MSAEPMPTRPLSPRVRDEILRNVTEILDRHAPPRMTFEAFLDWLDEDILAEWVDGEVIMTSPANVEHQIISKFLLKILDDYIEFRQLGRVIGAPFQMRLTKAKSGREPDLLFVATDHLDRLRSTFLDGPADLVVEIVSPESVERDRGVKLREYRTAGIPEYWLIDPEEQRVELNRLSNDGRYQLVFPEAGGILRSQVVPGFWLRDSWLWDDPKPNVQHILHQIGGDEYRRYQLNALGD